MSTGPWRSPTLRMLPALLACVFLAGATGGCGPESEPGSSLPAEAFFSITSISGPLSFSPDGSEVLATIDPNGIYNAYSISVAGSSAGAPPRALTSSETDAVWAERYFPSDRRVLVRSSVGGSELDHLLVREPDGRLVDLTTAVAGADAAGVASEVLGFTADGSTLFATMNDRRPEVMDLHAIDLTPGRGYPSRRVHENEGGFSYDAVSPDGSLVALGEVSSTRDRDLHLLEVASGTLRRLTSEREPGDEVEHRGLFVSPDGGHLYGTSDAGSETAYLVRWPLGAAAGESPLPETVLHPRSASMLDRAGVLGAVLSPDGRRLAVLLDRNAATDLQIYELSPKPLTLRPLHLPGLDRFGGRADLGGLAFSPSGDRLAFYRSTDRTPRNVFTIALGPDGAETPERHTDNLDGQIDPFELVEGRPLRFRSRGVEIPGILYVPKEASEERPVPAVVWVHGGPGGQSRHGFHPLAQYLAHAGIAVYAINHRGSGGYGKTFASLDDRRHGEVDLDDCVASRGALAATGMIDRERIAIAGAGYGGYLTLAALAFHPDAFAAGVDFFGPSNWLRTLRNGRSEREPIHRALEREMGSPDDAQRLRAMSPLFAADRITAPLLVLQGADDRHVLPAESEEVVEVVRQRGVPVEYVVFADEGHGFVRRENRVHAYRRMLAFLEEHLR